jgi:LacI family transcriptional regulator
MGRRPTIKELARQAGVGVATVDRVLNQRSNVRPVTIDRVLDTAERIGYPTRILIQRKREAEKPLIRFGFVLHKPTQEFYRNFARELETAVAARHEIRGRCLIRFSSSQAPEDFVGELEAAATDSDVLATSAVNHRRMSDVIRRLQGDRKPVISVLNDAASGVQQSYIGLDNMKVGRVAAWMIATQIRKPGKVAVFIGGNRWRGHIMRETGFRSYFRENAPDFALLDPIVNLETRQVTYEATIDLLNRHQDLCGIYVAGGGMEGAISAIREARLPGRVCLIVNELTEESRHSLSEQYVSMVIATPLQALSRILIDKMLDAATRGTTEGSGQTYLSPQLYVPESV